MEVKYYKVIDSTNDEAARLLDGGLVEQNSSFVVRADYQTDGRGQRGNVWRSNNAENLMFSYVFFPKKVLASDQFFILQAAALSVADYLKSRGLPDVKIKWPNDIYCGMRKTCGMLIENAVSGRFIKHCIVGIGLNINQKVFPESLPNPVSMSLLTKKNYNLDEEFETLCKILEQKLTDAEKNPNELHKKYLENLLGLEKTLIYRANGVFFKGIIKNVDNRGLLTVENAESGETGVYDFKEIELVVPEQQKNTIGF